MPVRVETLRRWEREGKLRTTRTFVALVGTALALSLVVVGLTTALSNNFTETDVRDLFTAQALLAGELVCRAAGRISEDDLSELKTVPEALRKAAEAGDGEAVERLNHDFHRRINLIADAPRLAWLLSISTKFAPRRFFATVPEWYRASAQDHAAILKALSNRDGEQARAAMMRHVEHAGDLLAAHFEAGQETAQAT